MSGYYERALWGRRLEQCYDAAPPRIRQYLEAEAQHVAGLLRPTDSALELGCGYGRIMLELAPRVERIIGIDTAKGNIDLAQQVLESVHNAEVARMHALDLQFDDGSFDAVLCLQNGICAFGVNQLLLLQEALRVTRGGGQVVLTSYADSVWPERLEWFRAQAAEGLIGEVDEEASADGVIVCNDGFRAGRMTPEMFEELCDQAGVDFETAVVDDSCVVCVVESPTSGKQAR